MTIVALSRIYFSGIREYNEACVSGDKESAYKDILSNYLYDYFIYYEGKVHSPLNGRFCGEQEECIAFKSIPNKEKKN